MMHYSVFSQTQPVKWWILPPEAKIFRNDPVFYCATAVAILYELIIFSSNEFLFWFVCTYCTTLVKHAFSNTNGVCCWHCVRMVCTGFELWCWGGHLACSVHSNSIGQCYSESLLLGACQWPSGMSIAKVTVFSYVWTVVLVSKWSSTARFVLNFTKPLPP